jgi:hypothetical protein
MTQPKLVLDEQETHGYKWEAYTIYTHRRETLYNSQYMTQHDESFFIYVSEWLHPTLPAILSPALSPSAE